MAMMPQTANRPIMLDHRGATMKQLLKHFWQEVTGATLVEYAVIVALISVAATGIIATVGGQIANVFSNVSEQLTNATDGGGGAGGGGAAGGVGGGPPAGVNPPGLGGGAPPGLQP